MTQLEISHAIEMLNAGRADLALLRRGGLIYQSAADGRLYPNGHFVRIVDREPRAVRPRWKSFRLSASWR